MSKKRQAREVFLINSHFTCLKEFRQKAYSRKKNYHQSYLQQASPTSELRTSTSFQIISSIKLKCTITIMLLNHPKTTPPFPSPRKSYLAQNQSPVPKSLGTADLKQRFSHDSLDSDRQKNKNETKNFLNALCEYRFQCRSCLRTSNKRDTSLKSDWKALCT